MSEIIVLSGDGDFAYLYDFAKQEKVKVRVFAFDAKSCSRMIKKRNFIKLSYLIELSEKIGLQKEKPPASTQLTRGFSD